MAGDRLSPGDLVKHAQLTVPATFEVTRVDGGYAWLKEIHRGAVHVARIVDCRRIGRMASFESGVPDILDWLFPWSTPGAIAGDLIIARFGRELVGAYRVGGAWRQWGAPGPDRLASRWTDVSPLVLVA